MNVLFSIRDHKILEHIIMLLFLALLCNILSRGREKGIRIIEELIHKASGFVLYTSITQIF